MSIELARKRAKKFFQYHKLSLPVKIDELLKHYADVKEAYIPVDGDAICLNNDKPLIIIKSNMSPLRKRFTYAHELAHLQIPSHTGMISCTTEFLNEFDITEYYQMEQEANAFAAELLMPSSWLQSLIAQHNNKITTLIDDICQRAIVSLPAAIYNIIPLLPANYLFIINNKINNYSHMKCGSNSPRPFLLENPNYTLDNNWLAINCLDTENIDTDIMSVKIYHFKNILDETTIQKIAKHISTKSHCATICNKLVSSSNINYAHLFKNLRQYLLPGTILKIEVVSSHNYKYIFAPNTYIHSPYQNNIDTDNWYSQNCIYHTTASGKHIKITVWNCRADYKFTGNTHDRRDSKTILHNIIDYYYPDKKERASLFGRINGIIGNLNTSQCSYSKQEFYNILKQKFLSRSDLEWITNTEEFDQFLFRKTEEIFQKKN